MAKKHKPDAMVDGMFMGASLLKNLLDMVIEQGGYPEQLHYLTTERGRENLKKVADCICECPWRVPRSLMEELSAKESIRLGYDSYESDRYHFWSLAADELGISTITFRDTTDHARNCGCAHDLIPQELVEQLQGKRLEKQTLVVTLNGEEYVVMSMSANDAVGNVFDKNEFDHISLTPANHFDMTR